MQIDIVTQKLTVLTLTDEEVEHYITHPQSLAQELIARGNIPRDTNEAMPKTRGNGKRRGKAKRGTKRASKSKSNGFECKHCHRSFARAGNRDNHQATCQVEIGSYQSAGE